MKLWATIQKDIKILLRDKVGLLLMFGMPILLVIIVTAIQKNAFNILDKTKITLLVCNKDTGALSRRFVKAINDPGIFKLEETAGNETAENFKADIRAKNAIVGIIIPSTFSNQVNFKAKNVAGKALNSFGLEGDTAATNLDGLYSLTLYYSTVLQPSFRLSIQGALKGALQEVESREILKNLYQSINEKPMPDSVQNEMLDNRLTIEEVPLSRNKDVGILNATQHNVPAWTIFAMFFVVMSLGSSIVKEKLSGSFIRLKTLPTHYLVAIVSKQITYLAVTMLQAAAIFAIGIWLFPHIGLPALSMPKDIAGLLLVTLICGWCAVSYAICVGVFAKTQEQANGFGAASIVILAIIGGIMIPSFIMPDSFKSIMALSPLHWCLEAYYGLFLEGGKLQDILTNIFSLIAITLILQAIAFAGLKAKKLI
ncbi:MAG: ABC transporter permease [Ferruginibacter sp.]